MKLKATARMIGGHFRDKFWLNGVSYGRNSCKGVETTVQQKAFGKYYNPIANSFFLVKISFAQQIILNFPVGFYIDKTKNQFISKTH